MQKTNTMPVFRTPFHRLVSRLAVKGCDAAIFTGFTAACTAFAAAVQYERSSNGLALFATALVVAVSSIGILVYLSETEKQKGAQAQASEKLVVSHLRRGHNALELDHP